MSRKWEPGPSRNCTSGSLAIHEKERKSKSSWTEARANWSREPKCSSEKAVLVFDDQAQVLNRIQSFRINS